MKHIVKVRDFHNNLMPVETDTKGGIALWRNGGVVSITHVKSGCAFTRAWSMRKAKRIRERLLGIKLNGVSLGDMSACEIIANCLLIGPLAELPVDLEQAATTAEILACEVKP